MMEGAVFDDEERRTTSARRNSRFGCCSAGN